MALHEVQLPATLPRWQTLCYGLALVGAAAALAVAIQAFPTLSATILVPSSRPDAEGSRAVIFVPALAAVASTLLLLWASRTPHHYRFPWAITERNAEAQYALARGLFAVLALELSALQVVLALLLARFAQGEWKAVPAVVLPVTLVVVLGTVGVYGVMALRRFVAALSEQSEQRRRLIEALESTRQALAQAEREAGMLEERARLSREIHDTLAQGFTSIVMQLETAETASDPARYVQQAKKTARANLTEARRLVWALRPEQFEQGSLRMALERIGAHWANECGIPLRFTVTGTPVALDAATETALLRALQEGLHNVRKHAGAKEVKVTLSYIGHEVALDIRDDGRGFDLKRTCDDGRFGLRGMQERVARLGGSVALESEVGEGTTLSVTLPVRGAT